MEAPRLGQSVCDGGMTPFFHLLNAEVPAQKKDEAAPGLKDCVGPWEGKAWTQITGRDGQWREESRQAACRGRDSRNPLEPCVLGGGRLCQPPTPMEVSLDLRWEGQLESAPHLFRRH